MGKGVSAEAELLYIYIYPLMKARVRISVAVIRRAKWDGPWLSTQGERKEEGIFLLWSGFAELLDQTKYLLGGWQEKGEEKEGPRFLKSWFVIQPSILITFQCSRERNASAPRSESI